jgi:hypothetical protein
MMNFLTYITEFFMNFELLPILTDYEIKKKGGWNKKKSSPLKLLSQFQPNFAEMILRWRIISAKIGWDWLSSFRGEDFF